MKCTKSHVNPQNSHISKTHLSENKFIPSIIALRVSHTRKYTVTIFCLVLTFLFQNFFKTWYFCVFLAVLKFIP